ncbi:MAG TPA: Pr6Pr family membrane protein [Edaphobacter sp.]|nr:Pr6Pr family membrane protein [Edaphobacter sp.]
MASTVQHSTPVRLIAALLGFIGWVLLALQLWLTLSNDLAGTRPTAEIVVNFFSFFTILSNLLITVIFTWVAIAPPGPPASLQAATASYMAVVSIGYSLLLRSIWEPEGLQKILDVMHHDILPWLYIVFWIAFCRRLRVLARRDAWLWLLGPLVYLIYSMVRGHRIGWYPYHFLDPRLTSYILIIITIAGFLVAFLGVGLAVVWITRREPAGVPAGRL